MQQIKHIKNLKSETRLKCIILKMNIVNKTQVRDTAIETKLSQTVNKTQT